MGLNGCLQFIKNKYPNLLVDEHISKYSHQRVFIDIAGYIYKYGCIYGLCTPRFLYSLSNLLYTFKQNKVHPIVVFDGKAPEDKNDEIDDRKDKKKQALDKVDNIEQALNNYFNLSQNISESDKNILNLVLEKSKNKFNMNDGYNLRLLDDDEISSSTSFSLSQNELDVIQQYINKLKTSVINVTQEHINKMKEYISSLGISYIQSPEEAESYSCFLVNSGYGSAVVSFDSDCIAHGAKNIIFGIDTVSGKISELNIEELLEEWQIELYHLKDFAILVGCDYNRKKKLAKIGPVNALKLLQEYDILENIPEIKKIEELDLQDINRIRSLFQKEFNHNEIYITVNDFCINKLTSFVTKNELNSSLIDEWNTIHNSKCSSLEII